MDTRTTAFTFIGDALAEYRERQEGFGDTSNADNADLEFATLTARLEALEASVVLADEMANVATKALPWIDDHGALHDDYLEDAIAAYHASRIMEGETA